MDFILFAPQIKVILYYRLLMDMRNTYSAQATRHKSTHFSIIRRITDVLTQQPITETAQGHEKINK